MANPLIQLSISLLLITFALSFENKSFLYKDFIINTHQEENLKEGINYIISYKIGDITKNYTKIKIKTKDENEYVYVYYSPISQNRNDSYLLNSGKDEIYLYINKAFTKKEANGFIYLTIACFTQNCSFNLTSSEEDKIDLKRNSQYKYFTTNKKNLINTFTVKAKEKGTDLDYITFYASGNKNIQMNIKYVNKNNKEINIISKSFDNGKYVIIKEDNEILDNNEYNNRRLKIIEVTAPANSLITFGNNVNTYKENELKTTKYIVNTNEIYGVLTKESNIQCFYFNIEAKTNSYLSILDFNKNLIIYHIDKNNQNIGHVIENVNELCHINDEFLEIIIFVWKEEIMMKMKIALFLFKLLLI